MPWVVDASALVEVLIQSDLGKAVSQVFGEENLLAPDLINPEVLSSLRRLASVGAIGAERVSEAVADLSSAPIERVSTDTLIGEVWSLRDQLTPYDACYVALARSLGCGVVTCDKRMSRAHNLGVPIVAL